MGIIIRRAVKEDCVRLMELIYQLAVYEKAPEEMTVTQEHFEESGFGENPVWWAFVAEVDGVVQGFALYYIRYSTWKGQRMYLEDFLVNEEMRGKGIGKLLFDRLLEEVKEKKFNGIVWQVLEYLGWKEAADLITNGLSKTIRAKKVTIDFYNLMKEATLLKTSEFADEVIRNL